MCAQIMLNSCQSEERGPAENIPKMAVNWLLFLTFLVCMTVRDVLGNICSLSYCQCEDSDVSCQGADKEVLDLSSSSLPSSIYTLSLSNMASVTIKTNAFSGQEELKELSLENIEKVVVEKFCFSKIEQSGHITHFKMENIKDLVMESGNSFDNFPQITDVVIKKVGLKVTLLIN